ncbi:UDP-N-acetylglucosamine transferase subunit [Myotisia sp. PD_48]|nr:UDP-N-acetylglucosamine transferase subunit [Myotisia sp. PD_48]
MAYLILVAIVIFAVTTVVALSIHRNGSKRGSGKQQRRPAHLLVVLGSGGHTEEMLSMLRHARLDPRAYPMRTYIVSSGDSFSARKAIEFETQLKEQTIRLSAKDASNTSVRAARGIRNINNDDIIVLPKPATPLAPDSSKPHDRYTILTVPRARKVHQSFLTAPLSTLQCLGFCLLILLGKHPDQMTPKLAVDRQSQASFLIYPDIILTNGPGTGVCVVIAARFLRIIDSLVHRLLPLKEERSSESQGSGTQVYLRTIFIESWARVTTLSLSGKILLPLVDRFLVQWEGLSGYSGLFRGKAEYVGTLLS